MPQRLINKSLAPLSRRVGNMLARGVVGIVNAAAKMQMLQVKLRNGEIKDGVEHFEPYGFTSHPKTGAEVLAAFFGGDQSHGVVLCVADRRYRLTGMEEGEVALFDDLGQFIKLARDGIIIGNANYQITLADSGMSINAGGCPVTISNASKVRMETTRLEVTGEIIAPKITQGAVS